MTRRPFAAAAVLLLASCGGPGEAEPSKAFAEPDRAEGAEDVDAFIRSVFGVSESELRREVEEYRIELAIECINERGVNLNDDQVRNLRSLPEPPPNFGGEVDYVISTRLGRESRSQAEPSGPAIDEMVGQCLATASEEFEDPFELLDDWISEMSESLSAQVVADTRYVEAAARSADCIQDLGFPSGDPSAVANQLGGRADTAITEFESGRMSRADRDAVLADLQEQENAVMDEMSACVDLRLDTERLIFGELQAAVIAENAERLGEVRRQLDERLRELNVRVLEE